MSPLENNLDPDKDLDRKKKELENKKLKVEIKNLSFERWKFFFGFIPIIGLLATIIFQIYTFRVEEEQHQESRSDQLASDYFTQFHAHPQDLEHKLSVSTDACKDGSLNFDVQQSYCQKIIGLENDISDQKKLDSLSQNEMSQVLSIEDKERSLEINRLDSLLELSKEELKAQTNNSDLNKYNAIKKDISSYNRQIDVIVSQSDVIKKTQVKTDSIDAAQRKIIGATFTKDSKYTVLIEEESWFKAGYFRQFGETRVSLDKFQSDVASISIKLIDSQTNKETKKIGSFTLKPGEKERIETDRFIYEIVFQRIGSAGKNPFNKAVYFAYRKYKN
ncbi:MAG: hypothetical protein ACI8ZM_000073 [Crocinitomix sp.]|jgi:hypothetical protein